MKIDRLVSIIMILLDKKRISAQELADMFEVSPVSYTHLCNQAYDQETERDVDSREPGLCRLACGLMRENEDKGRVCLLYTS